MNNYGVVTQSCEEPRKTYVTYPDGLRLIFEDGHYAGWYLCGQNPTPEKKRGPKYRDFGSAKDRGVVLAGCEKTGNRRCRHDAAGTQ